MRAKCFDGQTMGAASFRTDDPHRTELHHRTVRRSTTVNTILFFLASTAASPR